MVVGSIAGIAGIGVGGYFYYKRRKVRKKEFPD
ncbi:MAG: LPXTG cell wall anchor domain-containing protein [Candidatus Hodarchaeota archaeon]